MDDDNEVGILGGDDGDDLELPATRVGADPEQLAVLELAGRTSIAQSLNGGDAADLVLAGGAREADLHVFSLVKQNQ